MGVSQEAALPRCLELLAGTCDLISHFCARIQIVRLRCVQGLYTLFFLLDILPIRKIYR